MIKKLTLGSVVAAACLCSNVYAGDNLEEAFANGKFNGEVRSYYFQQNNESTGKSSIINSGGFLSYETDKFYTITAGATIHVSSTGDISGTNKFAYSEDASGAVLSEAFLTYGLGNSSIKVGRQYIGTPAVAGSGSRMIRQSFEGVTVTNTDIPDTKVMGIYVNKYQKRTDLDGNVAGFTKAFDTNTSGDTILEDGAYSLYLQNKSIADLTIQAQYLDAVDAFSTLYVDSVYSIGTDYNLSITGQYLSTDHDSGAEDGEYVAARLAGSINGFNLSASVSENTSDGVVESGLGYGADWSLVGGDVYWGYYAYQPETTSYQVKAGTTIADVGITIIHSSYDLKTADDVSETDYMLSYELMKNLNLDILHAEFDGIADRENETRVKLTYKF